MLKIYNTATRKIENFKPINEVVRIYTCGPTVYNFQHIGNYAAYIYWDLLIRVLKFDGYKVKRVLNFTDVGHLVSDGDEGEDKLEKGAAREGKSVYEVAKFYGDDFLRNFRALNLVEPDLIAHATDYIEDDIKAVDKITAGGYTYETEDGVYFDTSKFAKYADFARLKLDGLQAGARVDYNTEKRNPSDFAVWKFIKPGEKHAMRWDYLDRPGYPGWHLECSTIIEKELGSPIDIHTGGMDHIPVHHTNEIAQTFAMTGRDLAKYWLHCDFITINGEKISKSLGNVYTLDDLAKKGFAPLDFKMWVLQGHYQGTRNFTFDSLQAAKNRLSKWRNRVALCCQTCEIEETNIVDLVIEALNNNLNSPEAFKIIDNSELNYQDWEKIDELFGLELMVEELPDDLKTLLDKRQKAREEKDFLKADEIRDELLAHGIEVKDTADGPIWQYASS